MKKSQYALLNRQLKELASGTQYRMAKLANASALLAQSLEEMNWAGFYLIEDGKLVLGPFQGKVACMEIPIGRGVCGAAVERDEIILVKDVHAFPGHIACDSASDSEIVLPIHEGGKIIGVLDIDSPVLGRFDDEDKEGLGEFVKILEHYL